MMSNLRLKIFSLAVALMLSYIVNYFFVGNDNRTSVLQLIVPVEVKNVAADRMVIYPLTRQAEVTIQGPSLWLSRIASSPPIFRISIPAEAPNRITIPLKRDDLNLPPYVELLGIKPSEIEFTLDQRTRKSVIVNVPKIGTLPESLKLDSFRVKPDKVELVGPETEIKGISAVETFPLDLRDIHASVSRELEVRLPGTLTDIDQKRVSVELSVTSLLIEQKYEDLPVEVRAIPGMRYGVEPTTVKAKVSGTKEALANLSRDEIIPYVRLQKTASPGQSQKVAVELPKGVTLLSIEPENVTLSTSIGTKPGTKDQKKKGN